MARNIEYCAFWAFIIFGLFHIMNAAPMNGDGLLNKQDHSKKQEDCQVSKKYENSDWSGANVPFTAYVEEDEQGGAVSFSITYKDKDINLFRDKIILSQKENKIYEYRNLNIEERKLETYVDTSGWTKMEIYMDGQQILGKIMGMLILNHTASFSVKGLVIHGKHITICKNHTPTWFVQKEELATIPLEPSRQVVNHIGNRTYVLTLTSADTFTPCIGISENRKCLILRHFKELRFVLHLEIITGFINIYQEIKGKGRNFITFLKQEKKMIEISSDNKFSVSLSIFTKPEDFPDGNSSSHSKGQAIYLGIGIGFIIGIGSCLAIAIIVWRIWIIRIQEQASNQSTSAKATNKTDLSSETALLN